MAEQPKDIIKLEDDGVIQKDIPVHADLKNPNVNATGRKHPIKREYYCLIQNGMPVRDGLKNPDENATDRFDVFYGPYHGENGIRPQLLQDTNKRPKSFKDKKGLLAFFHDRCGLNNPISIFNAATGEIFVLGGTGGEQVITSTSIKPELKSLPPINFDRALEKPRATIVIDKPQTPITVDLTSSDKNNSNAELLNAFGLFATKFKTSRNLAFKGSFAGSAQSTPKASNFGIELNNEGPDNTVAPAA